LGKGKQQTTTTSTSSADPQAEAAYRDLIARASGVANTPYQAYSGELTAPINSQQQLAIGNINSNAGFAQPYIQDAAGYAREGASTVTPDQIAAYQNPYTQQVVDATQAQFNNQNQQAQQGLTSNAIAQGALGGNRTGVASANLAGQQQLSQAPVIAGLYSNSYQQALTAAQGDKARQQSAAYSLGNLGVAGQSAALSGAGAQLGAGTLQQQTQQAQDTANYGQYTQQQAYPFQTLQWLAGLQTGVGSQLGGTSTGTSTAPAPNQTAQYLGLGLSAAAMLSDERAKEDIQHIGKMNDGQNIYRYRYKGSPDWHIGPMAQEAEERHPEHVGEGVSGLKYIDLKGVTDDSARARGGFVPHMAGGGDISGTPWSEGVGWVPKMNITAGRGAPSAPSPSAPSQGQSTVDPQKIISQAMGLAGKLSDRFGSSEMGSPGVSSPLSVIGAAGDYAVPTFMASGGGIPGFALGGAPDDVMNGDPAWGDPANPNFFAAPDAPPKGGLDFSERFAPAETAIADGTFDPQGVNYTTGKASPAMLAGDVPLPRARPDDAPVMAEGGDDALPPAARPAVAGLSPESGVAPETPRSAAMGFAPEERSGLLFKLTPAERAGLLGAGLGMLSSRSSNLGNAIGDGGMAGFGAYAGVKKGEQEQATTAAKLAQNAEKIASDIAHRNRTQTEVERHNKVSENAPPKGFEVGPDGKLRPAEGGPNDPEYLARAAAARKGPAAGPSIDEDTIDLLAERVMAGDQRALIGFGRGAQGAENIAAVQRRVAEKAREGGTSVGDAARKILSNAAQNAGYVTASRRQATIMANLSVYGRTAFRATDLAQEASDAVPRTEFQPVNKVLNAYRTKTGDPKIVALGAAVNSLINEYARAISGGRPTVHDKQHAEEMLSTAQTPAQFRAVLDMMRKELVSEEKAMPEAKKHIEGIYNPSSKTGDHSVADRPGSKPEGGGALPPPQQRELNKVYNTPKGPAKWMGNGWQPVAQ